LKGWKTSETRLLEALENVCDNHFGCNSLLEEHEETIETWFFENQDVEIFEYLCVGELKSCCSDSNTFGKDCKKCPGYSKINDETKVCNDHGDCLGAGDRTGKGKCRCKKGYEGKSCQKCSKGYFKVSNDDGTIQCNKCEKKCAECEGSADNCLKCGGGFREKDRGDTPEVDSETKLRVIDCEDIDECAEGKECKTTHYCDNTPGDAICKKCDSACVGCSGPGNKNCVECMDGFEFNDEKHCVDVNECSSDPCPDNHWCLNSSGSYRCNKCSESCKGCTKSGSMNCKECADGHILKDDDGKKECVKEVEEPAHDEL